MSSLRVEEITSTTSSCSGCCGAGVEDEVELGSTWVWQVRLGNGIEGENGRIWEGGLGGRLKHGNRR
jgi:hypothetical protein